MDLVSSGLSLPVTLSSIPCLLNVLMFAPVPSFLGSSPAQISWFVLSLSLSTVPHHLGAPVIFTGGLVVRTKEATSDPAWHKLFPLPAPCVDGRDLSQDTVTV